MVSKITMFEFHLDGSQFGPASMQTGTESAPVEMATDESRTEPESKSQLITFLQGTAVFFLLFCILWVVLSRLSSDDEE